MKILKRSRTPLNTLYKVLSTYNPDTVYKKQGILIGPLNPLVEKLGPPNYDAWDIEFPAWVEPDLTVFLRIKLNRPPFSTNDLRLEIWGSDRRALHRVQEILHNEFEKGLYEIIEIEPQ